MSRKSFIEGQTVEVRQRSQSGTTWVSAKYGRLAATPGVHWVWVAGQQLEFSTRDIRSKL